MYGLRHEIGRFESAHMGDLAKELTSITQAPPGYMETWNWHDEGSKGIGMGVSMHIPELRAIGGPAVSRVLDTLKVPEDYQVNINHQPPHSVQPFHRDEVVIPGVFVVHASDGGKFDISLEHTSRREERAKENHISRQVNAGDVVIQFKPSLLHRGMNPSDKDRHNLVIYKPLPKPNQTHKYKLR